MSDTKFMIRFFTIADYSEEEEWLRLQHKNGWRFKKMIAPCFYIFEKCEQEDVIYRLDFKNNAENVEYMQMMDDFGWECCGKCVGWLYFRKNASEVSDQNDGELFSDNASRIEMIKSIISKRMLPIGVIFLCAVIPNVIRIIDLGDNLFFTVFWSVMFIFYVYIIVHCGFKLKKLKNELD